MSCTIGEFGHIDLYFKRGVGVIIPLCRYTTGGSFFYAIHSSMYTDRAMFRSHDDMKDHSESFILGFTGRIRWDVLRKGTERTCIYPTAPAVTNT